MATFITLVRFTPQGIGGIKESPKRLDAAKQAFRASYCSRALLSRFKSLQMTRDRRRQKIIEKIRATRLGI